MIFFEGYETLSKIPKILRGLPAYVGSKRQLADYIFGHIFRDVGRNSNNWFLFDAFAGFHAITLMAKYYGYKVISNDFSLRSYVVGKALVENGSVKLSKYLVDQMFDYVQNNIKNYNFKFVDDLRKYFLLDIAKFIEICFAYIGNLQESYEKYLLFALLIKYMNASRRDSAFSGGTANRLNLSLGLKEKEELYNTYTTLRKFYEMARVLREKMYLYIDYINESIFMASFKPVIYRMDVRKAIKKYIKKYDLASTILYLDPPYKDFGGYERVYNILEQMLLGRKISERREEADFIKTDCWKDEYYKLIELCNNFKYIFISFGGTNEHIQEFYDVVKSIRKNAKLYILEGYRYGFGKGKTKEIFITAHNI